MNQKEKPNKENSFVFTENLLETSLLLDDMKGIEKNKKLNEPNYYKPYLTNIVQLNDSNFSIQLSYMGVTDNIPVLKASFRILAQKKNNQYYFLSPLRKNTVLWKTKKIGNYTFHYKTSINVPKAVEFQKTVMMYDKKLSAPIQLTEFYCCDNFEEVQKLAGSEYISDYNGYRHNSSISKENNNMLYLDGSLTSNFTVFDPHDLFHSRLRNVLSPDVINRPVDEGCAYLYGGSWGISWKDILKKFNDYVSKNPDADWLNIYLDGKNFVEGDKPLSLAFVINALIIQKIEKEKGFATVKELLACGKKEKGDENYLKAIEKITVINKANFNV
ncbi:MAG: hypothetical protein HYZ42_18835 [Bacteroidetes bacterium]|nr:hypothetical protein [Bacteroidota bacterium]